MKTTNETHTGEARETVLTASPARWVNGKPKRSRSGSRNWKHGTLANPQNRPHRPFAEKSEPPNSGPPPCSIRQQAHGQVWAVTGKSALRRPSRRSCPQIRNHYTPADGSLIGHMYSPDGSRPDTSVQGPVASRQLPIAARSTQDLNRAAAYRSLPARAL